MSTRVRALLDRRLLLVTLAAYLLLRAFSAVLMTLAARHQAEYLVPGGAAGDRTSYWDMARLWDGGWYRGIAEDGYPDTIPNDAEGLPGQSSWAFYPLFPMVTRVLMHLTGGSFGVVGSLLALAAGAAAAVLMARLLADRVGATAAFGAVCCYAAFPASPVLQMTYTESLGVLLLCALLWAVERERWYVAAGLAMLTGLTRPIALPLGLVVLVAVVLRWRRREQEPIAPRTWVAMVTALVGCGVSGLIWPTIVGAATGISDGYTQTMSAWRTERSVDPFVPWWTNSIDTFGAIGPVLVVLAIGGLVALAAGPWSERLGWVLRAWCLGYLLYLLAVLDPGTSLVRYLLFLFPLAVVVLGAAGRRVRSDGVVLVRTAALVVVFLLLQVWWVAELLVLSTGSDNPI